MAHDLPVLLLLAALAVTSQATSDGPASTVPDTNTTCSDCSANFVDQDFLGGTVDELVGFKALESYGSSIFYALFWGVVIEILGVLLFCFCKSHFLYIASTAAVAAVSYYFSLAWVRYW